MSTRKLNVPALGFEIVVIGASDKTNKAIAEALEKKVVVELDIEKTPGGGKVVRPKKGGRS
jgi:hypothetical protein